MLGPALRGDTLPPGWGGGGIGKALWWTLGDTMDGGGGGGGVHGPCAGNRPPVL